MAAVTSGSAVLHIVVEMAGSMVAIYRRRARYRFEEKRAVEISGYGSRGRILKGGRSAVRFGPEPRDQVNLPEQLAAIGDLAAQADLEG